VTRTDSATRPVGGDQIFSERDLSSRTKYTVQYDDLVLAAIFATMATGAGIGVLTPLALPTAVTLAGVTAALRIAHGLFVRGPVDGPEDLTDEVEALN